MTAVTPSHAEGQVDVVVTTASGKSFTLDDAFTFTADETPGKPDAVTDLQIAGPDESGAYILSGMGSADGEVTVKDADGNIVGTATPAADGTWSVTIPEGTKAPLSITQTVNGVTSDAVTFNEAPLPVVSLGVAALALGTAGGDAAWGIRRRRNA
ncbi:hypothetical protein ATY41_10255 [Leifsonia xyli subsp. xyli]|uniref:Bacterial Ig domain-containing protein n=1 Tax=Leifsonia xyli subsp. xyli TaxID=59736 RepID=A0A1E2SKS7_LEIXY|nr:hypothetical protein ATY41_10255 [Leifsonia xyli subsp. xyli]